MTTRTTRRTSTQSPANEVIVALDLETTGVDPASDHIIEVGAVKFRGGEELGRFSSVVNPRRQLSDFIVSLTGITQADVDRGADWDRVAPLLRDFIGSHAILGHNVGFDAAFLRSHGVHPRGGAYDTSEMARIALPAGPEYSLIRLAERYSLLHDNPHRALSDALATRDLFLELLGKFEEMDAGMLEAMRRLGMSSGWSIGPLAARVLESLPPERRRAATGPIGVDLNDLSARLRSRGARLEARISPPQPAEDDGTGFTEAIAAAFSEGGALSSQLQGYEPREEQARMAGAVAAAIEAGENLVVEAGTGVGKSLAYLVPAAAHALQNGSRVIVSTNTINLQEQLVSKDLEVTAKVMEHILPGSRPLRSAHLKGRANYLCFRRWSHAIATSQPDENEARVLGKLLVWLQDTCTGDRSELALGRDYGYFTRFSAQGAAGCPPQDGPCFLRRARSEAGAADVVVINHAMLMSDIVMGGGLLPEHDVLVIDEAHHLQDAATRHLGISVSQYQFGADLIAAGGENGSVASYGRTLQGAGSGAMALDTTPQTVAETLQAIELTSSRSLELFPTLATFAGELAQAAGGNDIRLTDAVRSLPQWEAVKLAAENVVTALAQAAAGVSRLLARQDEINTSDSDQHATVINLSATQDAIVTAHQGLRQALIEPQPEFVYWLSLITGGRAVEVHGAPLDVSPLLREKLFERERTVILTGATLSHEGRFDRMKSAIGLDESEELALGSPFDYRRAALIAVPEDIADPGGQGYARDTAAAIASVARGVRGGRTLALFTSNSALENARRAIVEKLAAEGIKVIGQGHDGPPQRIMQTLAGETDIVALGTSSLWEGADLQGAGLDALVMARLPFPVPSEPVFSARNEQFEDGFNEYAVPEAVLRFRQGFGRLIRSKTDRGIFVVLDRRIITKAYGRSFQRSLPKSTVRRTKLEDLETLARKWKLEEEV